MSYCCFVGELVQVSLVDKGYPSLVAGKGVLESLALIPGFAGINGGIHEPEVKRLISLFSPNLSQRGAAIMEQPRPIVKMTTAAEHSLLSS